MYEYLGRLEKVNSDANHFLETMSRFHSNSNANETFLSVGFHPNRTTSSFFPPANRSSEADRLIEKVAELKEQLLNIELLIEKEKETMTSTKMKLEEAEKDHVRILLDYLMPIVPVE